MSYFLFFGYWFQSIFPRNFEVNPFDFKQTPIRPPARSSHPPLIRLSRPSYSALATGAAWPVAGAGGGAAGAAASRAHGGRFQQAASSSSSRISQKIRTEQINFFHTIFVSKRFYHRNDMFHCKYRILHHSPSHSLIVIISYALHFERPVPDALFFLS